MAVIRKTKTLIYDTEKRVCSTHPKAAATVYGRSTRKPKDTTFVNMCAACFKDYGMGIGVGLGQEIILVEIDTPKPERTPRRHIQGTVTPRPLRGAAKKAAEAKEAAAKVAAAEPASQPASDDTMSQPAEPETVGA